MLPAIILVFTAVIMSSLKHRKIDFKAILSQFNHPNSINMPEYLLITLLLSANQFLETVFGLNIRIQNRPEPRKQVFGHSRAVVLVVFFFLWPFFFFFFFCFVVVVVVCVCPVRCLVIVFSESCQAM